MRNRGHSRDANPGRLESRSAFAFRGVAKADYAAQLTAVNDAIAAMDTAEGPFDAATAAVAAEHAFFKSMNVALGQRLDSEVANDQPLQKRVDEADDIDQQSDPAIERRTHRTIPIWKEVNAVNAAMVPVRTAVVVRGVTTAAQYETRYQALQAKKTAMEETGGFSPRSART